MGLFSSLRWNYVVFFIALYNVYITVVIWLACERNPTVAKTTRLYVYFISVCSTSSCALQIVNNIVSKIYHLSSVTKTEVCAVAGAKVHVLEHFAGFLLCAGNCVEVATMFDLKNGLQVVLPSFYGPIPLVLFIVELNKQHIG